MDARRIPFWYRCQPIINSDRHAATRRLDVEPNLSFPPISLISKALQTKMPASISTRLDEQEFLDLADCYYVTPRREMTDNPSRTGSMTTISTNTHLRRRDTTPGPRWRPSTLKECDDSGSAGGQVDDEFYQYDIVEGQTFPIDPLKTPSSMSLESYDTQTFRTAKGHADITVSSLNIPPPRIQIPPIDPVVRSPSSLPTKVSRPISTASLVSRSCFGIIFFPRWNMKGSGKPRKQKKRRATQFVHCRCGTGESSGPDNGFSTIPLNSDQSGGEYFMSLPSQRGFASASSSPLVGLDYDYHLAVEVLIDGPDVEQKAMP